MVSIPATLDRRSTPPDDHELLCSLNAGDEDAMAEIWRRHSAAVFRTARRTVGSDALAQEVAQDAFVTLWKQSERVDLNRGSILTFLRTVTRNRSIDIVRREVSRREREERVWANSSSIAGPDDPIDLVVLDDLIVRVRAAVARLPNAQRESVELAWFGGLTYRDVATSLGLPEGTVKTRIREGLRRLSATMSNESVTSVRQAS